jgi:K(+)-stimulated pyrophosphate-energized sodium pump
MQGLTSFEQTTIWVTLVICLIGAGYAFLVRGQVLAKDRGTDEIQNAGNGIRDGALTYLGRTTRTVIIVALLLGVGVAASSMLIPPTAGIAARYGESAMLWSAAGRGVAFLVGAIIALVVGTISARMAVEGNVRTTAAARKGYNAAMQTAYRSGTIGGMLAAALSLAAAVVVVLVFGLAGVAVLASLGIGGAIGAVLMPASDTIYLQAAHVAAAQQGNNETDQPGKAAPAALQLADAIREKDDDCAGMTRDVFEHFDVVLAAALVMGALLADGMAGTFLDNQYDARFLFFPLLVRGVSILAALIGTSQVTTDDQRRNARAAMSKGFYITTLIAVAGFAGITFFFMGDPQTGQVEWRPLLAVLSGVLLSVVLERAVHTFAPTFFNPYKKVNRSSLFARFVMGCNSIAWSGLVLVVSIGVPFALYAGAPAAVQMVAILYGMSLAGLGMLTLKSNMLSTDRLRTVAHNARHIGQVADLDKNGRNVLEDLDEVGKMTRAIARGNALALAIIAVLALIGWFFFP